MEVGRIYRQIRNRLDNETRTKESFDSEEARFQKWKTIVMNELRQKVEANFKQAYLLAQKLGIKIVLVPFSNDEAFEPSVIVPFEVNASTIMRSKFEFWGNVLMDGKQGLVLTLHAKKYLIVNKEPTEEYLSSYLSNQSLSDLVTDPEQQRFYDLLIRTHTEIVSLAHQFIAELEALNSRTPSHQIIGILEKYIKRSKTPLLEYFSEFHEPIDFLIHSETSTHWKERARLAERDSLPFPSVINSPTHSGWGRSHTHQIPKGGNSHNPSPIQSRLDILNKADQTIFKLYQDGSKHPIPNYFELYDPESRSLRQDVHLSKNDLQKFDWMVAPAKKIELNHVNDLIAIPSSFGYRLSGIEVRRGNQTLRLNIDYRVLYDPVYQTYAILFHSNAAPLFDVTYRAAFSGHKSFQDPPPPVHLSRADIVDLEKKLRVKGLVRIADGLQ